MPAFVPARTLGWGARRRCTPYSRLDVPVLDNDDFLKALELTRNLTGRPGYAAEDDLGKS